VRRGDVFDARLDPTEGSEQAGWRPIVVVSRDAINNASNVVIGVPCTTFRSGRRVYPSQVLLRAGEAGLDHDSVALGEQVRALAKSRLGRQWGTLPPLTLRQIERALAIALDLRLISVPHAQG
jgi:mRNA interferase MazF